MRDTTGDVDDIQVRIKSWIKYLGLYIDRTWSFEEHFARLAPRLEVVTASFGCLFPGLRWPDERVRRLYAEVVRSVALYGAPVWTERALASRHITRRLRGAHRRIAIRASRAYRTVSEAAAEILSGLPPLELFTKYYAEMYRRMQELRGAGTATTGTEVRTIRFREWQILVTR